MADVLLLKWNNHENSFLSLLSSLRKYNFHTDATLACDGQLYQVHKVVLSACSDYFSHIFQSISCPNPVIVLKDMSPTNVESLLDYMYLGEARIKQIDLAALIQAADCLKLKGLAVNLVNNPYTTKNDENISQNSKTPVTTKTVDDSHSEDNMNSEENLKTEQYEDDTIQKNDEIVEAVPFDIDAEMKFDNSGQEILSATIKPEENCNPLLTDPLAGTETETSSLEIHNSIETASSSHNCSTDNVVLPGMKSCVYCNKEFITMYKLNRHIRIHTGERPFPCQYCPYRAKEKYILRDHIHFKHRVMKSYGTENNINQS